MKFQKNDIVQRALPSGLMVGGLMAVVAEVKGKYTTVRDVSTGKYYIYKSSSLEKVRKIRKIMGSESDMNKIDAMKGVGSFYHVVSPAYDKLYANPPKFVCFILSTNGKTTRRTFYLGEVSKVLRKVDEIRKGYSMVPVKKPMYKLRLIGEL